MKETQKFLINRWEEELKESAKKITKALKSGKALKRLNLPLTEKGLIDLRGFSTPKKYKDYPSKSGKTQQRISESIEVKGQLFSGVDFSYSDFERCIFTNCRFQESVFIQTNLAQTRFLSCKIEDIIFEKTNFGQATFNHNSMFFTMFLKDNFRNVSFEKANLSEVVIVNQKFINSSFADCKTGFLRISGCSLLSLKFIGLVKNLFIQELREVENIDFREAVINGLIFNHPSFEEVHFPEGENYYFFEDKTEELEQLIIPNHFTEDQKQIVDLIKTVWLKQNPRKDFVDLSFLKENEMETGRMVIRMLKGETE